jgi:hypothetical protein
MRVRKGTERRPMSNRHAARRNSHSFVVPQPHSHTTTIEEEDSLGALYVHAATVPPPNATDEEDSPNQSFKVLHSVQNLQGRVGR